MRVATYTPRWRVSAVRNGVSTHVDFLLRALAALGHERVFVASRRMDEDASGEVCAASEAFAMGCPTIVPATFGPAELLNTGGDIVVADIGDADRIATHIQAATSDPDCAKALGGAVGRHFSAQKKRHGKTGLL